MKRWIYAGRVRAVRSPTGKWLIPESEILRITGRGVGRRAVLYVRVSSRDQVRDGDLERQVEHLLNYAREHGFEVRGVVREVASGLNDKRPKLMRLLRMVAEHEVDAVLVEYKDRLTRFGYNYLDFFCQSHGCKLISINDEVKKDALQELVEDMISVVQSFCARLYGRRSHKYKKIVEGVRVECGNP